MVTPTRFDMHLHLDFMSNASEVVHDAARLGLGMLAVSVTPDGFLGASAQLESKPNVHLGLGLHPWWVADGRCGPDDIMRCASLAQTTRYIGEIGLDLSPRHVPEDSIEVQLCALRTICDVCARTSDTHAPKVLSIHSVRAAGMVLDTLHETGCLDTCACIFHWFSGSSEEMSRAVRAGCYFSINEMMLKTRRGREYARQLPQKRVLLETDLPPQENAPFSAAEVVASLERVLATLSTIRKDDMRPVTCDNALRLLGSSN